MFTSVSPGVSNRAKSVSFFGGNEAFHVARAYMEIETVKRGVNVSHTVSHQPCPLPMDTAFHFTDRPEGDRETQTPCGVHRKAAA